MFTIKIIFVVFNKRQEISYPISGTIINGFLPNLSDQGPMNNTKMMGGTPLMKSTAYVIC